MGSWRLRCRLGFLCRWRCEARRGGGPLALRRTSASRQLVPPRIGRSAPLPLARGQAAPASSSGRLSHLTSTLSDPSRVHSCLCCGPGARVMRPLVRSRPRAAQGTRWSFVLAAPAVCAEACRSRRRPSVHRGVNRSPRTHRPRFRPGSKHVFCAPTGIRTRRNAALGPPFCRSGSPSAPIRPQHTPRRTQGPPRRRRARTRRTPHLAARARRAGPPRSPGAGRVMPGAIARGGQRTAPGTLGRFRAGQAGAAGVQAAAACAARAAWRPQRRTKFARARRRAGPTHSVGLGRLAPTRASRRHAVRPRHQSRATAPDATQSTSLARPP